ncbi:hypothetical protein V6N13_052033 [Hibiscus sabdariffa]
MESDLLEISDEDNDSLILQHQQTLTDAVSTIDPSFFSCSPLHFPTSNPTDVKAKNPIFSSNIDKENFDGSEHKSELQKLSLEPQKMKKKRKGGGYNLRKSLAWDRAFFTEEGVLNSTELSLISGNFSKLSGEKLLAIEEEPVESLSIDSPDLQALEDNLFKELPCNNSNTKVANKIANSSLRQKSSSSASRSAVKQNVLSIHDVNRSGSKRSGCPRPVIPANVSTTKTAVKEPKISKVPAPKSGSSTTRSSPNLNKPKRNQSVQAVSAHRSIALTGSNKSTRSTQNDAKSSVPSKSQINKLSATQPKRNVKSSALASHSSALSQHPLVTKPDNGLKVNQDPVVASGHGSIYHEAVSKKVASLLQSHCHTGGNTQYSQPQMAKPSGLRMPSPSLGFFTQSKANASHNIQSSTQKCNNPKPNIPNLTKLGVLHSTFEIPTPSKKIHVVASDVAAIENSWTPSTKPSVPSSASSFCKDVGPNSRDSKMRSVEVKASCTSYNHELTNNRQQSHTIDGSLKQQTENAEFQYSDNKLLLQSQSSEHVKLDCKREDLVIPRSPNHIGSEFKDPYFKSHGLQVKTGLKADDAGNELSGNGQNISLTEDFDLLPQLHSCEVNSNNIHGSPIVYNDPISIHDNHEHSSKPSETECVKSCTFEDDQITSEIHKPHINDGALLKEVDPSEEFLSFNSVAGKGICPNISDCNASNLERTNGLLHYGDRIPGNDGTVGTTDLNQQSHVADAQKHSFECNLPFENSNCLQNALEANNLHAHVDINKKLVEQPPLPDPCIVVETVFQDNYGSHSTDCPLHGEIFSSEDVACQSELANSGVPCKIPPTLQNCVQEMAEVVECLNVENEVSVSTDTQCNHDIGLLCEATSPKGLERIEEDKVTWAITACDIGVSNDCQRSGNLDTREMDDSHSISPLGLVDVIKEPGEKILSCHFNAPGMLTNSLMDKQNELIQSSEAGNTFLDNPTLEACHDLFSAERNFLVESQNFDRNNCADVGSRNKGSVIQAVEGPDQSRVRTDEPSDNCAAGDNEMTNGSFSKDAFLQSFNDGISFDSCKINLFTSAENINFAVVENLNKPHELQNVVTVMPEPDKFGLSVTEEISSYVTINLSDKKHDGCNDMILPNNEQSCQVTSLNVGLSSLSEDQVSGAENTCKSQAFFSLTEESISSIKTSDISSNESFLQEELNRLENDVPQELNSSMTHAEAKGCASLVEETGNDRKQVAPLVKPPLNAVPFSDEWLAAIEAAGEEILTMKSGAVQNSPTDKSLPEPGPWSPVQFNFL